MIIDETRYIWKNLMDTLQPAFELYSQIRPLVLLPFNIWFFFVSLPFRLFFAFTNVNNKRAASEVLKEKAMDLKERAMEIKDRAMEMTETVLPRSESNTRPQLSRSFEEMEDRPHGWYAVEKKQVHHRKSAQKSQTKEKSVEMEQVQEKRESKMDESAQWKDQLSALEKKMLSASDEKTRLETQLEELNLKFTADEKALASFEQEKRRFKNLINVEQKKCHDSQLEIISLKNQLKNEHESRMKAEQELSMSKKQEKSEKKAEKKKSKKQMSETSIQVKSPEATTESHNAWHADNHMGYTEMVASAQLEESKHKKFSDVLKDSLSSSNSETKTVDSSPEFVVIGGDLSSKHVIGAPTITSSN